MRQVKLKAKFTNADDQVGGWHFLIIEPKKVEKLGFEGKSRRVLCSIKGAEPFPCALMPWGDIFYIMVNKLRRAEHCLNVGDTVDVVLQRDDSKYGMPMNAELAEVLKQDPEGSKLFHSLTAGKQRSMIWFIGKIKDIDKRIHTALIFVEHLKNNDGKLINEVLKEELKRPAF